MAEERNWSFLNCLCYLYNAFADYTDGDLDEAEKKEILVSAKHQPHGQLYEFSSPMAGRAQDPGMRRSFGSITPATLRSTDSRSSGKAQDP